MYGCRVANALGAVGFWFMVCSSGCVEDEEVPFEPTTTKSANATSAQGSGGANGTGHLAAYNCTFETADDLTGNDLVTITEDAAWQVSHSRCIIVSTGTVVRWNGNFGAHPLRGGPDGMIDNDSPITAVGEATTGTADADVTFDTAGDFAYFCTAHPSSMTGVVYVVDP